ncbi:MAG: pentapeptide repeat-containing protein, partial [Methanothrix sp.]|nr:pentapeptide repeat-containing protein [Methanothrix sp.]
MLITRNKDVRSIAGYLMAAFAILILSGTATSTDLINKLQDGSNLKYSDLQGANLSMAHLNRSDLSYSLLQGSDLS